MIGHRLFVLVLAICSVATLAFAAPVEPAVRPTIESFNYHGVTLDGGPYKAQLDDVHAYYLNLADDDLLKPFRIRARHPAPGRDLGGWYSSDTFHIFGQIISGLSRIYAATGDEKCREKANHLVDEWSACIAPDGYFYAAPPPNSPHYIYDKMVSGLLDDFIYCHHQPALLSLSRITDWAQKKPRSTQGHYPPKHRMVHPERKPLPRLPAYRGRQIPRFRPSLGIQTLLGSLRPPR